MILRTVINIPVPEPEPEPGPPSGIGGAVGIHIGGPWQDRFEQRIPVQLQLSRAVRSITPAVVELVVPRIAVSIPAAVDLTRVVEFTFAGVREPSPRMVKIRDDDALLILLL